MFLLVLLLAVNGEILWNVDLPNITVSSSCFVSGNSVVAITQNSNYPDTGPALYAFNADTGAALWQSTLAGPGLEGCFLAHSPNPIVAFACSTTREGYPPVCLGAVDLTSGKLIGATFETNLQGRFLLNPQDDGSLIFTSLDSTGATSLLGLDHNLNLIWNTTTNTKFARVSSTKRKQHVQRSLSNDVFILSGAFATEGYSIAAGKLLWTWKKVAVLSFVVVL